MAPLERYYKLPEQRREQLLLAARAEFASHGFERASYNRIIEAAKVSKGAMYYYFADKADLFGEVIDRGIKELVERVGPLRAATDADDFWASLWEWLQSAVQVAVQDRDLAVLLRCLYHESTQRVVARLREQVHALLTTVLQDGQRLGAVRDDVPTDMLAVALSHLLLGLDQWFADRFEEMEPAELERLSLKSLELCRDLAAPGSAKSQAQAQAQAKPKSSPRRSS